jgi:uncharacterized protein YjiS (DUF1127 family)
MMSYNQKELEALAMIQPVQVMEEKIDIDALVYNAHVLRSQYVSESVASFYKRTLGKLAKRRHIAAAKRQLHAMTDRELNDIGITRSDIDYAVEGKTAMDAKSKTTIWNRLKETFVKAQKARAGYAQLMAMDARQLADIGLVKGDIEAAVNGNIELLANDNVSKASGNNEHRHAV